jgi:hypothetical protein
MVRRGAPAPGPARFTLLAAVAIDRRRLTDRDQLALFPALASNEPGDARVVLAPQIRANIAAGHTTTLTAPRYFALSSPVARRIYRLLEAVRPEPGPRWKLVPSSASPRSSPSPSATPPTSSASSSPPTRCWWRRGS